MEQTKPPSLLMLHPDGTPIASGVTLRHGDFVCFANEPHRLYRVLTNDGENKLSVTLIQDGLA